MPTASRPRRGAGLLTAALLLAAAVAAPAGAAPTDVFAGATWFVDPDSRAAHEADRWRSSDPARAALFDRIAVRPQADWFGDWFGVDEVDDAVAERTRQIRATGALPVYVLHAIPARDCGGYSAGGTDTPARYRAWIDAVAAGLDGGPAADTGAWFADGLAAGALAARLDGVMLLAPPDRADAGQLDWLRSHRRAITATVAVGGELALSERVVEAMDAAGS